MINSCTQCGIGNVPEVPCYQEIDTALGSDGDMCRIVRGVSGNCFTFNKKPGKSGSGRRGHEKCRGLEDRQAVLRGGGIASARFGNHELRCNDLESVRGRWPTIRV